MKKIVIPGRPVPYVRMTRAGKYIKKYAQRYLAYKETISYIALSKVKSSDKEIEIDVKVYLYGKTTKYGNCGDVDNYLKSAMDGLNKIAYVDDKQVVRASVEKISCNKNEERMEIYLKEVG